MKAKYLLVLGMFVLLSSKLAFAQSYCGNALRIDFLKCEYVNTGTSQYCKRSYTVGQSVSCTGNPNDCFTVGSVCGSSDECTLQGNTCVKACGRKQCWVNPGDDPPPPPPPSGGSLCGASCTSSSQCGGLTCAVGGVCYGPVCDTGTTPANHRVRVKVFDCNNNLASGVKVSAWGNNCTTNSSGECVVGKGTSCNTSQLETPVLAGVDAGGTNYYSRVNSPSFERGDCGSINCNYNNSATMSSPYRQAYKIDMAGETVSSFTRLFCATSDAGANTGFNFKQINCPTANAFPNISISGPSSGVVGTSYTWNLSASDADDGVDIFGAYIGAGTSPSSWTQLNYTDLPTPVAQKDDSTSPWTCTTPGTYTIAVFAKDAAGQHCSGNPTGSAQRCASNPNDRKTFTCSGTNMCTGPSITCSSMCTTSNQMKTTCTWNAPNGLADNAFAVGIRYCSSSSSCDNWFYKSSDNSADSALFSRTVSGSSALWKFEATGSDSLKQYKVRVKTSTACTPSDGAYGTVSGTGPVCGGTLPPQCIIYGLVGDMFVDEVRNYTVSSTDPDGGNMVFTGLYSAPTSSATWSLLGQSTSNSAAGSFRCTTPGTYYLACTARDNDNTFCSGSPFPHSYADCGSFDSRTVVCKPKTAGITLKNEIVTTSQSKGTSPYKGGDIITFKVTVTNTSSSPLSNVVVSENIPSYTSFAPTQSAILNSGKAGTWVLGNGKYNFNIGTLAAGVSYSVYYAVGVTNYTTPGTYASSNTACSSATGVANGPCGTVNFDLEDIVATKKLKITQELVTSSPIFRGSSPFVFEDVLVFRITATNEGNQRLDNVELQDTVPAYTQFLSGETNNLNGTLKGSWECTKESAGGLCNIAIGSLNPNSSYFVYYVVSVTNYIDTEADIKSKNDACAGALDVSLVCSTYPFDLKDLTVNPGTKIGGLVLNYTSGPCEESSTNSKLKASDVKDGVADFKLRNGTAPPVIESYNFGTNKFYFEEILDPTKNTVICADKFTPAATMGGGSFRLACVKLNGSTANLVQNSKCTADLSSNLNFENSNTLTLGFEYVPVSADPWIQTESGDVYSGSLTSGESIVNIIQKVGSYMVTKIGSVFGNKDVLVEDVGGATLYSQRGSKVQKFIKSSESAWPDGFEYSSPSAQSLNTSSCNLDNRVYKASSSAFSSWLATCADYSVANDGLSVIYVSGNTTFDNEAGLLPTGSGRLIVVVNGSVNITDTFSKDSNKAGFGLIAKNGVEFANSGLSGLDTLEFEGFIATSGSNKDIRFVRSLEVANEEKPAVKVIFDPKYILLLSNQKLKNADEALGLTKFDLIWEIYD